MDLAVVVGQDILVTFVIKVCSSKAHFPKTLIIPFCLLCVESSLNTEGIHHLSHTDNKRIDCSCRSQIT